MGISIILFYGMRYNLRFGRDAFFSWLFFLTLSLTLFVSCFSWFVFLTVFFHFLIFLIDGYMFVWKLSNDNFPVNSNSSIVRQWLIHNCVLTNLRCRNFFKWILKFGSRLWKLFLVRIKYLHRMQNSAIHSTEYNAKWIRVEFRAFRAMTSLSDHSGKIFYLLARIFTVWIRKDSRFYPFSHYEK